MSDVDDEQRRWCDPRAAVLVAKLASVVSDPVAGVAGEAEGAPATPATVEIRDQELVATARRRQPTIAIRSQRRCLNFVQDSSRRPAR